MQVTIPQTCKLVDECHTSIGIKLVHTYLDFLLHTLSAMLSQNNWLLFNIKIIETVSITGKE